MGGAFFVSPWRALRSSQWPADCRGFLRSPLEPLNTPRNIDFSPGGKPVLEGEGKRPVRARGGYRPTPRGRFSLCSRRAGGILRTLVVSSYAQPPPADLSTFSRAAAK